MAGGHTFENNYPDGTHSVTLVEPLPDGDVYIRFIIENEPGYIGDDVDEMYCMKPDEARWILERLRELVGDIA